MKKVVVGMSGGVDSSVAALLLLKEGYEVIGVTFKFTDDFDPNDAEKVCEKLGIKHIVVDYKNEFKEKIIYPFLTDYQNGLTPNPCVLCNKEIKFNFLYQKMLDLDCDYIATGHYAKIINNKLYKSADLNKDQTYFLAQLSSEKISRLLLPLEGITKEEVRLIAQENGLENALKKDSTDVCFITSSFSEYISENIQNNSGDVIDIKTKKVIGQHSGLAKYTIGQRKGLNIGGCKEKMYVVGKDIKSNVLYIAFVNDNDYLISTSCLVTNYNMINKDRILNAKAKFRYRQSDNDVEIEYLSDNEILVKYSQGIKSVTPGQTCVIYNGDECLGGGMIKEVYKDNQKLWYL